MKHGWLLLWVLLTGACLVDNPRYVPEAPDLAPGPPDMAPTELFVPGGTYALAEGAADGGASAPFSVSAFYLDVHEITDETAKKARPPACPS